MQTEEPIIQTLTEEGHQCSTTPTISNSHGGTHNHHDTLRCRRTSVLNSSNQKHINRPQIIYKLIWFTLVVLLFLVGEQHGGLQSSQSSTSSASSSSCKSSSSMFVYAAMSTRRSRIEDTEKKEKNEKGESSSSNTAGGRGSGGAFFGVKRKAAVPIIEKEPQMTLSQILAKAGKSGIGGGIPGAIAGVIQVFSLMWLRTVMNYQCRYGTPFHQVIATLYREGGIPRFYRGLSFALVQAPLVRFVSTAANDGVETLLTNLKFTETWGLGRTTFVASFVVGIWRMILMPIDTCKTVLQVDSAEGFRNLMRKVKAGKVSVLYEGALANAVSTVVSHYPWFYTYNYLTRSDFIKRIFRSSLLRNAGIGFLASVVSDAFANVVRVVKTTKQSFAAKHSVGYREIISMILAADGWKGLFGRGLRARILGNAFQSVIFTVIWRGLAESFASNEDEVRDLKGAKEENSESDYPIKEDTYQYN